MNLSIKNAHTGLIPQSRLFLITCLTVLLIAPLNEIWAGDKAGGVRCKRDHECASNQCSGIGKNRTCTSIAGSLAAGTRCKRNEECASRQCSGFGDNRRCTALGGKLQTGERCKRDRECKSSECSGLGNNRKCRATAGQLQAGAECERNKECQSGQCSGFGSNRKCTALSGQLKPGARCKRDKECKSGECAGLGSNRVCRNYRGYLPASAGCERNKECKSGQCTGTGYNRKCTELTGQLAPGATCKRNKECSSGQCWRNKCTADAGQLPPGAGCTQNKECKSGECYGTGKNRKCTAMTGSLLPGEPCRINKECQASKCDRIAGLDEQFCEFAGWPCQAKQKKPAFPIRSSTTKRGVYVRWLGTAGFEVSIDDMRIIIDPFIARPWRHFTRGKAFIGAALGNTVSRAQLAQGDPTLPQHMKYYNGIKDVDWIFVTHGHVDHAAEAGPLILNLARKANQKNEKLKIGVIGDKNFDLLLKGYEQKFGLHRLLGVDITQHVVPYDLGGSSWTYVTPEDSPEDPFDRVTTYKLGNGVTTTWYPGHHSQGKAATTGWTDRTVPAAWPMSMGSYHAHGIHNVLIEARGLRILFLASTEIHFGKPHKDPLPEGPIDVVLMAIPAWDTGNADHTLRVLKEVNASVVIPTHYDDYFWEWRDGCYVMEYANLPRFLLEAPELINSHNLDTDIRLLDYGESYHVNERKKHGNRTSYKRTSNIPPRSGRVRPAPPPPPPASGRVRPAPPPPR